MDLRNFTMAHARVIAGGGSFALTMMVFVMMWLKPELADNDLFKSLSQAVVIQGLIGLVMAFLFTGNSRGSDSAPAPTPTPVVVEQPPEKPIPVEEAKP